jgi:hypothetical protein
MLLNRRRLLTGLIAAPLVVAAGNLMPLRGAAVALEALIVYPFTLSWWERVSNRPGVWRQNASRFMATQIAPCIEVNPCIDTDCVAGVQVDASPVWLGGQRFDPPPVSTTWREGPKMFDRGERLWGGSSEIELSKGEELALMGWTGKEPRAESDRRWLLVTQ